MAKIAAVAKARPSYFKPIIGLERGLTDPITDLNMGAMNGIELIKEARKIPALRFVPILMLTTESQTARRQEAKAAGASGWLVKPVDGAALMQVLSQLLPDGAV